MFEESLEMHRKDGRVFDIRSHPFYPVGEGDLPIRFRPFIYELYQGNSIYLAALDSEETAEDAIAAGMNFVKAYEKTT